eukprot:9483413-Pyramimonas_sp.AAC.1
MSSCRGDCLLDCPGWSEGSEVTREGARTSRVACLHPCPALDPDPPAARSARNLSRRTRSPRWR